MEQETVASIIGSIDHLKDYTTDNPDAFTRELCLAFMSQISLIKILFSGRELSHLGIRLDKALKEVIFRKYPNTKTIRESRSFSLTAYRVHTMPI